MTFMRFKPDDGPPVTVTPAGTEIAPGETPEDLISVAIGLLMEQNRVSSARETSLAKTKCEEAIHWIEARNMRRSH